MEKFLIFWKNTAFVLLLATLFSSSNAYADDDAKHIIGGIAAGIVGLALDEMSKENEQQQTQQENIQWNEQQASKSTLQYDARVAEIQKKLKKTGYYIGKVDGLKGRETTGAIETWEQINSNAVDGEMSEAEMLILDQQIEQEFGIKSTRQQKAEKIAQQEETKRKLFLQDLLYDQARFTEQYEICKSFKDNYVTFAYRINKNLEKDFKSYSQINGETAGKLAACKGMGRKEFSELREKQQEKYDNSQESQLTRIRAGHVFIEDNEDRELVLRCEFLVGDLKDKVKELKSRSFDEKGCEN